MTTVRELITGSLRLIEQIGAGQTVGSEDSADALTALVQMIDSWSIQGGGIFTETIESFNLNGSSSYTIGSGGSFNTTRPVKIRSATYHLSGDTFEQDLEILSMEEYASQPDKSTTGYPKRVYYNGGYPLGTFIFHPLDLGSGVFKLFSEKPLTTYTSVNDSLVLPPGYERALRYNLAVEIAPEYGKMPSQTVMMIAAESKSAVENKNSENDKNTMRVDDALVNESTFNIFSGL